MPPLSAAARRALLHPNTDARTLGEVVVSDHRYIQAAEKKSWRFHINRTGFNLEDFIQLRAVTLEPGKAAHVYAVTRPGAARFIDLIDVISVAKGSSIPWVRESSAPEDLEPAAGTPWGAALPDLEAVFERDDRDTIRFGISAKVPADLLEVPQLLARFIDTVMQRQFRIGLEADVLAGDGSSTPTTKHLTGITQTAGVTSTGVGGDLLAAIVHAVAVLTGRGYQPLVGVVNPGDLETLRTTDPAALASTLDTMPELEALMPSNGLAPGTTVVGDAHQGVAIARRGDLNAAFSTENDADFIEYRASIRLQAEVEALIEPRAWVVITGP